MNSKTGIEIPGEPEPDIYSREKRKNIPSKKGTWSSRMSIPYMAHGYELRMTPIQILAFYSPIATDGFYVPRRLGEHGMGSGGPVEELYHIHRGLRTAGEASLRQVQTILVSEV